jgi:hypothetical protein
MGDSPNITLKKAIAFIAAGAAEKNCRECHGLGTRGTLRRTYRPHITLICPCAAAGFPRLRLSPHIIILPPEEPA